VAFHEDVIDDWPSDDQGDLDLLCFRTAMALAQLPVLRPAPGGRAGYGFPQLAISLNAFESRTGFRHNNNDLRRSLARLARIWSPDDDVDVPRQEVRVTRTRLPDLARQHGFPAEGPAIPGVEHPDMGAQIYRTLVGLKIVSTETLQGLARADVRLSPVDRAKPRRIQG
jgi:hypothetical protein